MPGDAARIRAAPGGLEDAPPVPLPVPQAAGRLLQKSAGPRQAEPSHGRSAEAAASLADIGTASGTWHVARTGRPGGGVYPRPHRDGGRQTHLASAGGTRPPRHSGDREVASGRYPQRFRGRQPGVWQGLAAPHRLEPEAASPTAGSPAAPASGPASGEGTAPGGAWGPAPDPSSGAGERGRWN